MITAIYRLPDVSHICKYTNTMETQLGLAGREVVTPAGLAFYKIISINHPYCLEYVVAATQNFDSSLSYAVERISGTRQIRPQSIKVCPISVKVITPDLCDNFIFTDTLQYLLSVGGCPTVNTHGCKILEFSNAPSMLLYESINPMCVGGNTYDYGVLSMTSFLNMLTDEHIRPYVPEQTHTTFIDKIVNEPSANPSIEHIMTVNSTDMLSWIFDMISLAVDQVNAGGYPSLPSTEFAFFKDRFEVIYHLITLDPVLSQCLATCSLLDLVSLRPFFADRASMSVYETMANNYQPQPCSNIVLMDTTCRESYLYGMGQLLMHVTNSPLSDLDIVVENGRPTVLTATSWNTTVTDRDTVGILGFLVDLYRHIGIMYKTNDVKIIRLNKNWLDEIWIGVSVSNVVTYYYIPLWYWNITSPCVINQSMLKAAANIFNKI
jgi:hypothetical protein